MSLIEQQVKISIASSNNSLRKALVLPIFSFKRPFEYIFLRLFVKNCVLSLKFLGFCAECIKMMGCFDNDQREYLIIKQGYNKLCPL